MKTHQPKLTEEEGFTLLEMIVAMAIFTLFVGIFIGAVSGLVGSITDSRETAQGSGTNENIINNLAREVSYAEAINFPGPGATGIRYIEFQLPKSATGTDTPECVQWRYDPATGGVAVRSWSVTSSNTAADITAWASKGTNVVDEGGNGYPFTMLPASIADSTLRQRLQVTLSTGIKDGATSQTTTTLVARNSSGISVTNSDANGDGQSDTQVCMQAGGRP